MRTKKTKPATNQTPGPTPQARTDAATAEIKTVLARHACKLEIGHTITVVPLEQ